MKKRLLTAFSLIVVVALALYWTLREDSTVVTDNLPAAIESSADDEAETNAETIDANNSDISGEIVHDSDDSEDTVNPDEEPPEELSEEEKLAQEEDRRVEEFDSETDRWMDAEVKKSPTMADIEGFRQKFSKIPAARKEECLQRALNLIPDDNVMLLTGILMDKAADKEQVQLIYNDILNRDEVVKKPILQIIFQDKEHPCWADTAWILDVTGELPEKN